MYIAWSAMEYVQVINVKNFVSSNHDIFLRIVCIGN